MPVPPRVTCQRRDQVGPVRFPPGPTTEGISSWRGAYPKGITVVANPTASRMSDVRTVQISVKR